MQNSSLKSTWLTTLLFVNVVLLGALGVALHRNNEFSLQQATDQLNYSAAQAIYVSINTY